MTTSSDWQQDRSFPIAWVIAVCGALAVAAGLLWLLGAFADTSVTTTTQDASHGDGQSATASDVAAYDLLADPPAREDQAVLHLGVSRLPWREVTLRLDGATAVKGRTSDLLLHLQYLPDTDRWHDEVWGYGLIFDRFGEYDDAFNGADQRGRVVATQRDGDDVPLRVELDLKKDRFNVGFEGPAIYDLAIRRTGDRFSGTYRGTVLGKAVSGEISGEMLPVWPTPVTDFQPLRTQEHPRLMFRASDLTALRARAETPEGEAIIARMKRLLEREFNVFNGVGWGMLYQITGDRQYAQRAAEATVMALQGRHGKDGRYAMATGYEKRHVRNPGSALRLGPTLAAVAHAYDLCYDAWNADLKRSVVQAIQERLEPLAMSMHAAETINPHSNHYGAWNGGAGVAVLAILGDPHVDDRLMRDYLSLFTRRVKRAYRVGFGDRGWFTEGHHPSRIAANTGLSDFVQAYRNTCGLDLSSGISDVRWTALRWAYNIVPQGGQPQFPRRGPYGGDVFDQSGNSHDGDFAHGFGLVSDPRERAAMLWVYEQFIMPHGGPIFNAGTYPHRAAAALVNWPIGLEPVNPAQALPRALRDEQKGYFMFRNRWKDADDTLVTLLINSNPARGCHDARKPSLRIFGLGMKWDAPDVWVGAMETSYQSQPDGSGIAAFELDGPKIDAGYRASFAVDFSPDTGCEGGVILLVETWDSRPGGGEGRAGPIELARNGTARLRQHQMTEANTRIRVWTLADGTEPSLSMVRDGDVTTVNVGKQTFHITGHVIQTGSNP